MRRSHMHDRRYVLVLVAGVVAIEIIGGLHASSLALLADATGLIAYAVEWPLAVCPDVACVSRRSELARVDPVGAPVLAVSALCLSASIGILYVAYSWSVQPRDIRGETMLMTAIAGLIGSIGVIAFRRAGHCLHAAHTERFRDIASTALFAPVQVVIAAMLVMVTGWPAIDRIVAAAIAFYVMLKVSALAYQTIRYRIRQASATNRENDRKGKNRHG